MADAIPLQLAVFLFAGFLGALVAGVAGFAFGLIASAIWLHVITPAQGAALVAAYAILIQGATLWKLRHAVRVSRIVPFVVGAAIGIPLGVGALNWATPAQMQACTGAALILFSIWNLTRPRLPAVRGGRIADGVVGILSGVLGGSTGLAGIPVIVWANLNRWSKDEQRALFQPVVLSIFAMTLFWFGGTGAITRETLQLFLIGLPGVLIGAWLGFRLYGKLDEARFRVVVLALLLLSGFALLWPWLTHH
jgi:uncharacterized membrane protein YfcA